MSFGGHYTRSRRPGADLPCIAGEILSIKASEQYHTDLLAKDLNESIFRMGFTFPERIPEEYLKVGCTILVLHPVRIHMPAGGRGYEVNSTRVIKILPFKIAYPFDLSERLETLDSIHEMKRICAGCDQRKYGIHKCPMCRYVSFCNRDCQRLAKEKGHRTDCAVLRDPDMPPVLRGEAGALTQFRCFYLVTHTEL